MHQKKIDYFHYFQHFAQIIASMNNILVVGQYFRDQQHYLKTFHEHVEIYCISPTQGCKVA